MFDMIYKVLYNVLYNTNKQKDGLKYGENTGLYKKSCK